MPSNERIQLVSYQSMNRSSWRQFRPAVDANIAAVSVNHRGCLAVLERRPSASEVFYQPPTGVYWVDMSVHHSTLELELPTAEGVFSFLATVDVAWRIVDPVLTVKDGITIGDHIYRPYLERKLRDMGQKFEVHDFADAERQISTYFADRAVDLTSGIALVRCDVKIAPDEGARTHIQQRTFDSRAIERRNAEHKAHQHGVALQHDSNNASHKLSIQDIEQGHEIKEAEQNHYEELERKRISHYTEALKSGGLGALALQLASNPEDIASVVETMLQDRHLEFESAQTMLLSMLNHGVVNRRDAQAIVTPVAKVLSDRLHPAPTDARDQRATLHELTIPGRSTSLSKKHDDEHLDDD